MGAAGKRAAKVPKDPNALTKAQLALLRRIRAAGGIFRTTTGDDGAATFTWYFVNGSGRPNPSTVAHLIAKRRLAPTGDGLFVGCSQSFVPTP